MALPGSGVGDVRCVLIDRGSSVTRRKMHRWRRNCLAAALAYAAVLALPISYSSGDNCHYRLLHGDGEAVLASVWELKSGGKPYVDYYLQ